jgi:hypothetical protein
MVQIENKRDGCKADLRRANLLRLLESAVDHYYRNVCTHEDTHRGGFLWTICDGCGSRWADDQGGFVPFHEPQDITEALAVIKVARGMP